MIIRLFNGEVNGDDMAFMSPDELFPNIEEIKEKHDSNENTYSKNFVLYHQLNYVINVKCRILLLIIVFKLEVLMNQIPLFIFVLIKNVEIDGKIKFIKNNYFESKVWT